MKKKIKYGIIGCGVIANLHADSLNACNDAQLFAVCDIIEQKAIDFKEKYGATNVFFDYHEMLNCPEIDAVCICTPSGMHADMVIDCAKAKKHILCEKPLDITTLKLDSMIEACKENDVKLAAVFQNRTYSGTVKAKEILQSGILGKILVANAYGKEYRSPAYYKSAGWRGTWALDGGGCMMNQNVHCLDLLCWWVGDVESVYAKTFTLNRDIEVEDSAFLTISFKNGAKGQFSGSTIFTPGHDDFVEIQCEKGRIVYDTGATYLYSLQPDDSVVKTSLDSSPVVEENTASDPTALSSQGHTFFIENLTCAIQNDEVPYITGESARKAVDLILASYQSSKTQKEIILS